MSVQSTRINGLPRRDVLLGALGAACSAVAPALTAGHFAAPAAAQEKTATWDLHYAETDSAPAVPRVLTPWAASVAAAADGALTIRSHPAMGLGGGPGALFAQAAEGRAALIWARLSEAPRAFRRLELFETPFLTQEAQRASAAFHPYAAEHAPRELSGLRVLAAHLGPPAVLHLSRGGLSALEQGVVRGLRIYAASAPMRATLSRLGAAPVRAPAAATGDMLARGVVDGVMLNWLDAELLGVLGAAAAHLEPAGPDGWNASAHVLAAGETTLADAPEEAAAALAQSVGPDGGAALASAFGAAMDAGAAGARTRAVLRGAEIQVLRGAPLDRWRDAAMAAEAARASALTARGVNARALLTDARRRLADAYRL